MKIAPFRANVVAGLCGFAGVAMLVASFAVNPGAPPNATESQLVSFATQNFDSILDGAWLQSVGPLLIVLFAVAVVYLAGAANRIEGWMTILGGAVLMMVSLAEVTLYIGTLSSDRLTAEVSYNLIYAVQHLYFIMGAPAVFLPLGLVILRSSVLPRLLGYLAIILGAAFVSLGIASLYDLVLPAYVVDFAGIQSIWWLAAAIMLALRPSQGMT
jgi:hypothetical protein